MTVYKKTKTVLSDNINDLTETDTIKYELVYGVTIF